MQPEALRSAAVTERVQVLRGGQAHAYVVAEEHEDGSLLLAPEPVPSGQDKVSAKDGRADIPSPSLGLPGSSR